MLVIDTELPVVLSPDRLIDIPHDAAVALPRTERTLSHARHTVLAGHCSVKNGVTALKAKFRPNRVIL
jgi:hypothetical protein